VLTFFLSLRYHVRKTNSEQVLVFEHWFQVDGDLVLEVKANHQTGQVQEVASVNQHAVSFSSRNSLGFLSFVQYFFGLFFLSFLQLFFGQFSCNLFLFGFLGFPASIALFRHQLGQVVVHIRKTFDLAVNVSKGLGGDPFLVVVSQINLDWLKHYFEQLVPFGFLNHRITTLE